jgi:exonuclease SbcD
MKILHLADLHLGKVLLEHSLIEDQEYCLKQIINKIKDENIDIILISGDVYDKNVPTLDAVNLLNDFLNVLIKELNKKVFIIAGNHDSKDRLSFGSKILENEGLFIEAKYTGKLKKVELEDEFGKLNIYMLPFIKPVEVKNYFEDEIISYNDAVHKIIEKEKIDKSQRNIIMIHQFVTAGTLEPDRTESEVLSLGGSDNVDVSNFDDFDYVAIGHVHRPQRIGRDTARYSGTMLKYSFSEVNHNKTMPIIDFKEKDNLNIELCDIKPLKDMRQIKGPILELLKKEVYEVANQEDYIRAIITDEDEIFDAIGQLRRVYPNILKLEIRNSKTLENFENKEVDLELIRKKSELELFNEFYKMQNNMDLSDEQIEIMKNIIQEVKSEAN